MNHVAIRPQSLNILSICTGGGGLDLGVELAIESARTVCMVEREAFAVAHLVSAMQQGLMAPCAVWSDARTFDGRRWRGSVDGLIGGIPCQPHSLAGKRLGRGDERDLWSTARRIIVQSGAWFVLIENVRGMLSSGGAERVWRDLSRLGFASEGGLFTASEVGASHERERFFILAVADARCLRLERWGTAGDLVCPARDPERQTEQRQWHGIATGNGGEGVADAVGERAKARFPEATGGDGVGPEPAIADHGRDALVDTARDRWRKGMAKPEFPERHRPATALASAPVGDASVEREWPVAERQPAADEKDADAHGASHGYLFPPGPSDRENWEAALERAPELEPAFRRVADGLASRLDIARVDRLRMLGNGVVSLEAAYAVRTLATRLAASGSRGAARLVRMMAT